MIDNARNAIIYRIMGLRRFWQHAFLNDDGSMKDDAAKALKHYGKFCYAGKSCAKMSPKSGMIDPIATGIAEGRREAFIYLTQMLEYDEKELQRLINQPEE